MQINSRRIYQKRLWFMTNAIYFYQGFLRAHSISFYYLYFKGTNSKLIIIGAGLPRTGTNSLRTALSVILDGPIYHMYEVFEQGSDHVKFWEKTLASKPTPLEWTTFLEAGGYRGGLDHPLCLFYK